MEIILRIFLCFSGLYQVTEDLVKAGTSEAAVNGVGGLQQGRWSKKGAVGKDGSRRKREGECEILFFLSQTAIILA